MTEPINHLPGDAPEAEPEQQLYDQEEAEHQAEASGENVDGPPKPPLDVDEAKSEEPEFAFGITEVPPEIAAQLLESIFGRDPRATRGGDDDDEDGRFTKPNLEDVAASLVSEEDYDGVLKALEEAYESGRDSILTQAKPIDDLETQDPIALRLNEIGAVATVVPCGHPGHKTMQWVNGPLEVIVDVARRAVESDDGVSDLGPVREESFDVELGQVEYTPAGFQIVDSKVTINVHNHHS